MTKLKVAQDLIDIFYPVGSYYETSDNDFNPNIEWGGTWREDSAGLFTLAQHNTAFPIVGNTGGSRSVVPTGSISGTSLGIENLPGQTLVRINANGENYGNTDWSGPRNGWGNYPLMDCHGDFSNKHGQKHYHNFSGNSISIMNPYIIVRRWHRTA